MLQTKAIHPESLWQTRVSLLSGSSEAPGDPTEIITTEAGLLEPHRALRDLATNLLLS